MSLPPLSIPNIALPIEIPHMIHPLFVHLSIALPIVIILLEVINLLSKRRTIGVLSFFFMLLLSIVLLLTYYTGITDAQLAKDMLTPDAKEALAGHKQLGIYLVYASLLVLTFKLIAVLVKKTVMRVLFFLVIIVFTAAVINEGKKGGELVYTHGINVKTTHNTTHNAIKATDKKEIKKEATKTEATTPHETKPQSDHKVLIEAHQTKEESTPHTAPTTETHSAGAEHH